MSFEVIAQSIAGHLLKAFTHAPKPTKETLLKSKVIAHRNAMKGYKENTLESMKACLRSGVWGIEFDVRFTKDNIPVVIHDATTKRTHNSNIKISNISFKDLRQQHEDIPTLSEVVHLLKGNTHLFIELKVVPTPEQETNLKNTLSPLQEQQDFHIMSINPKTLDAIKQFNKKTLVTISILNPKETLLLTKEKGWGATTGSYILIRNSLQQQAKQDNIIVGTGYIDDKFALYRELNRGIDWIFTNRASDIMHILQQETL